MKKKNKLIKLLPLFLIVLMLPAVSCKRANTPGKKTSDQLVNSPSYRVSEYSIDGDLQVFMVIEGREAELRNVLFQFRECNRKFEACHGDIAYSYIKSDPNGARTENTSLKFDFEVMEDGQSMIISYKYDSGTEGVKYDILEFKQDHFLVLETTQDGKKHKIKTEAI